MGRKALSKEQEEWVCIAHQKQELSQASIARRLGCSQRTVARVLVARGLATAVPRLQDEARQVMKVLKKHQVDPKQLDQILKDLQSGQKSIDFTDPKQGQDFLQQRAAASDRLEREQVQLYLNQSSEEALANMFFVAATVKAMQHLIKKQAEQKTAEAKQPSKKVDYGFQHQLHYPSYSPK